jgi:hypothetical protein
LRYWRNGSLPSTNWTRRISLDWTRRGAGILTGKGADILESALRAALRRTGARTLLNDVLRATNPKFEGSESRDPKTREALRFAAQAGFLAAFFALCAIWPYRILAVAAPQGRRGDQLTIE